MEEQEQHFQVAELRRHLCGQFFPSPPLHCFWQFCFALNEEFSLHILHFYPGCRRVETLCLRNLPPHISTFLNIELFHLFGFTDNPSAWQPGNVTPARPNNRAINATRLQEKCKFNKDINEINEN